MRRGARRRESLALRVRIEAHLRAHPGELYSGIARACLPAGAGTTMAHRDRTLALQDMRADGLLRYVTRTSVPFDPVATHCGWWLTTPARSATPANPPNSSAPRFAAQGEASP